MMVDNKIEENKSTTGIHPLKFSLWLIIISIMMMFAAFTSAYIVRREEGNWLEFDLPGIMLIGTLIIILSSVTIQWAYVSAKKDNLQTLKLALTITAILGVTFLVTQWEGWVNLVENNIYFGGMQSNPAGSFLYVLTGVHGFHLITGLIFLVAVLISTFNYKVHSKNMLRMQLCTIYWHFLSGLWLYLYIFLRINH